MESSISASEGARTVGTQPIERRLRSSKRVEDLLPGIPDEITLEKICTKLSWRAFKILSLVSPTWRKAIESRQVFNARVRARSTETLVVHCHGQDFRIALYSIRDECCYELPLIPHLGERIPLSCECIGLDGKIYAIGGERWVQSDTASAEVFVLDVAGCKEWKQCASMQQPRLGFGCGISGGKIYVFGGISDEMPVCGSEVYDPTVNSWSPIKPMPYLRCHHGVVTVGEEHFVYGGEYYYSDVFEWDANARANAPHGDPHAMDSDDNELLSDYKDVASFLEVYHPRKNEWRVVKQFALDESEQVFFAKGGLHAISHFGVDVYDIDKGSWTKRRSHCFPEVSWGSYFVDPYGALAVDNDLFATISCRGRGGPTNMIPCLLQSQGFDSGKDEVVWQRTCCPRPSECTALLFPIEL